MLTLEDIIQAENTDDRREYGRMSPGITVFRQGRALVLMLPNDGFRVLSTSFGRGGFVDSPEAVVNISGMGGKVELQSMMKGLEYFNECNRLYMTKLGLDPERSIPFGTAANMDNASVMSLTSENGVKVSIAITGGIRHNGGRAGDPASYDEAGAAFDVGGGTIITMISIDADLTDSAMYEAMLIAAESKSCVIQDLQARSLYSQDVATGSGTDQVAIIVNKQSPEKIESLDRDSGLARAIAEITAKGLKDTFDRQSGMTLETQRNPMVMLSRYGMDRENIRDEIRFPATMDELLSALDWIEEDGYLAIMASVAINMEDDVRKGLMLEEEAVTQARTILEKSLLGDVTDPVERIRLDSLETIPEIISYVSALTLMDVVKRRRSGYGQ